MIKVRVKKMKKVMAVLVCFALLASGVLVFAGCGKQKAKNEEPIANGLAGGWTRADSPVITEDFRKVFDKATETLTGVEYIPVAYLSSQVVAGTNHRVLCKATATVPDAVTTYEIVTVYEDLNGGAQITEIVDCYKQANVLAVDGSWSEPDSPAVSEEARQALTKACETLTGVEYSPVALLATQVVAGMNYRILCEFTPTVSNAETGYLIVTVYADLQGNAEITDAASFVSGPVA